MTMTVPEVEADLDQTLRGLSTQVDEAQEKIRGLVAEAKERQEEAEAAAATAGIEFERLEEREQVKAWEVVETARRLHDEARHEGALRFCHDPSCTTWTDLFLRLGWGT